MSNDDSYDSYNREEIYFCSHLFRLLHEGIDSKEGALGMLLSTLSSINSSPSGKTVKFSGLRFENIKIFCEAALLRDKYKRLLEKDKCNKIELNVKKFMDDLVESLMKHYKINDDCRMYSELKEKGLETSYPGRIIKKALEIDVDLTKKENEKIIYEEIQKLFYSSPDLLITIDDYLIVIEAKFTQPFSNDQLERTRLLAEIWAELLYKDLGFRKPPDPKQIVVYKLGKKYKHVDKHDRLTWENIYDIAYVIYEGNKNDRSLIAFERAKVY
ncbi:MAG: hypothetical protein LBQ94_13365 [Treponema sp.]|jgi:hypothetical protein|nr:hypothetical protein [Treponema sp.]